MSLGFLRGTTLTLAIAAFGACSGDPVAWSDVRYSFAGIAGTADSTKEIPSADEPADSVARLPLPIPDSAACRASIRLARSGKSFYAVWWSVRPDSSAILESSRSDDGGAWTRAVIADSGDVARRGCSRPPPSIATDPVSGYVHIAYFLEPSSGAGVFSVHSMDRDSSFHSPAAMVYGARQSNVSIAAEGDRVAVAYEDPNSTRPQILVALSKTMGHIFESRIPVSDESASAMNPVVKLRGTKLEVSWTERPSRDPTSERHASRTGIWR
jgi:hypothetical protein